MGNTYLHRLWILLVTGLGHSVYPNPSPGSLDLPAARTWVYEPSKSTDPLQLLDPLARTYTRTHYGSLHQLALDAQSTIVSGPGSLSLFTPKHTQGGGLSRPPNPIVPPVVGLDPLIPPTAYLHLSSVWPRLLSIPTRGSQAVYLPHQLV